MKYIDLTFPNIPLKVLMHREELHILLNQLLVLVGEGSEWLKPKSWVNLYCLHFYHRN